jgi:hypothetical protein
MHLPTAAAVAGNAATAATSTSAAFAAEEDKIKIQVAPRRLF